MDSTIVSTWYGRTTIFCNIIILYCKFYSYISLKLNTKSGYFSSSDKSLHWQFGRVSTSNKHTNHTDVRDNAMKIKRGGSVTYIALGAN